MMRKIEPIIRNQFLKYTYIRIATKSLGIKTKSCKVG